MTINNTHSEDENQQKSGASYADHATRWIYARSEKNDPRWKPIQFTGSECEKAVKDGASFFTWTKFDRLPEQGQPEPVRFGHMPLDFDCKEDIGIALNEVRQLCLVHLPEIYGIDPNCIRFYASGEKGFHAIIPANIFGSADGDIYLPYIYKKIVIDWIEALDLKTVDTSLYCLGMGKMFRLPNIKRNNGRYKVQISIDEIMSLPVDEINKLTESPRRIEMPDGYDTNCPDMADLFEKYRKEVHKEHSETKEGHKADFTNVPPGEIPACISYIIGQKPKTSLTSFNKLIVNLTKYFQAAGVSLQDASALLDDFLQSYPHSTTYTDPKSRRKHFRKIWMYHDGRPAGFSCSYILGMKFPGNAFDCKKCFIKKSENDRPIQYWTGSEILKAKFPEPKWIVPGVLPEGLCLLGGKPKIGKSIMTKNLAIACATGGQFFGHEIKKCRCLLFGLEDSRRRFQGNILKMTGSGVNLDDLFFYTEFPQSDNGGIDALNKQIEMHEPHIVIIDTLKKFRAASNGKKSIYAEDYDAIDELKRVADQHNITIIVVHHLRKMESEDPFDSFSGSLGLTGAADTLWVLNRGQGGTMTLHIKGRDMEDSSLAVEMSKDILTWRIIGNADDIQNTRQQQSIFDCLKNSINPLSIKDIMSASGSTYKTVIKILSKMVISGKVIKTDRGKYKINNNGDNGYNGDNGDIGDNGDNHPF